MITRKYQAFISSPFKEMEDARKAAIAGVSDANHIPIALDNFAPESTSDLSVIKRVVEECHVYILILGPYYGTCPAGSDKSYTEIEYDLACNAGRYVLVFVLAPEDVEKQREKLDFTKDEKELSNTTRLKDFHARVSGGKHFARYWHFKDTESIRRFVAIRLTDLPHTVDAPRGLVQETSLSPDLLDSLANNEFVRDTVAAIRSFDKLYNRTTTNVYSKIGAAEFLAETYHARMESRNTKGIFFESGSSIAFLARALPDTLWQSVKYGVQGDPKPQITTNNALVYLHLWLNKGIPCAQFPWGTPEKTYGASYGPIGLLREKKPNYKGEQLNNRAKSAIRSLETARLALTPENTSLIIMATSGLQLGQNHTIIADDGYVVPEDVIASVKNCFGPHVGSYYNKVFKRYLFERKIPTIIMLDSKKIDSPIDIRKCHFICDTELPWNKILHEQPIAFCIGFKTENTDLIIDTIVKSMDGFQIIVSDKTRPYSALIARNKLFCELFNEESELIDIE